MCPAMGSSSPESEHTLPERIALHVVEASASTGSIAVILCCAEADADALAEHMARIEARDVRLVVGIERDTVGLRDELAAITEQSLVVICKTDELGADAVRHAVECFGLRRTWTHRLLVLQLSSIHSTSWIGSVHRTLAAMTRRRSKPSAVDVEVGSVQGEILGSVRDRTAAPDPDRPAVVLGAPSNPRRDEVGPIPAHVRAPGRRPGHLALVMPVLDEGDDDTHASISDACLVPPVVPPRVVAKRRPHAMPGAIAAILAAALVGTIVDRDDEATVTMPAEAPAPIAETPPPMIASMPTDVARVAPIAAAVAEPDEVIRIVVNTDADRIDDALADGRAQRHDGWIVWNEAEAANDWWGAANLCRQRSLAGLRGWRLPTIAEARALRRAGVLPKVDVWTLGRDRDSGGNWLAAADGTFEARAKDDTTGWAACVRKG
jgi:hypothetical protein